MRLRDRTGKVRIIKADPPEVIRPTYRAEGGEWKIGGEGANIQQIW